MTELALGEAVSLGYALVARVAHDAGVRVLAIKGPTLEYYELRAHHESIDVDVLVAPESFDIFSSAMAAAGWTEFVEFSTPQLVLSEAVTFRHPHWPCEVDAHRAFPGMLADPRVAFEELWERRETVNALSSAPVVVPDRASSAIIFALHLVRDLQVLDLDLERLAARISASWSPAETDELMALAASVGALVPLRELWQLLGMNEVSSDVDSQSSRAENWRLRTIDEPPSGLTLLVNLRRSPKTQWPHLLRASVAPPRTLLLERFPERQDNSTLKLHLVHIFGALRSLPRAARLAMRRRDSGHSRSNSARPGRRS